MTVIAFSCPARARAEKSALGESPAKPAPAATAIAAKSAGSPAAALSAFHPIHRAPDPRFPSMLMVRYEGNLVPVVAASGKRALIEVGGRQIKTSRKSEYVVQRADQYAPGEATFSGSTKRVTYISTVDVDSGASIGGSYGFPSRDFVTTVTVGERHEQCFVAVLMVNRWYLGGQSDDANSILHLKEIGTLEANRPKHLEIDLSDFGEYALRDYVAIPLLFDAGREVHSNNSALLGAFQRRRDLAKHVRVLANYLRLNPSATLDAQPYLRFQPTRPGNAPFKTGRLEVIIRINAEGRVFAVDLPDETDDEDGPEIGRALLGWLFLPQLEAGSGVETRVRATLTLPTGP